MTDETIREGFNKLKEQSVYEPLYLVGLSRAIGDWISGMDTTRLYTLRYGRNRQVLSIRRVQTPTLAPVVSRQRKIDNFKSETYWVLVTIYRGIMFTTIKGRFDKKEDDEVAFKTIRDEPFIVTDAQKKRSTEASPELYDLTSLQVDCNKKFGYSTEMTLNLVQSLYEEKYTTYPRMDIQYLSDGICPRCLQIMNRLYQIEIQSETVYAEFIKPLGGKPLKKSKKMSGSSKVTDHHAIIPTGMSPMGLSNMEENMFDLIAQRFIAVFYDDCKFATITVMGKVRDIEFKTSGKEILVPGWRNAHAKSQWKDGDADEKTVDEERTLPTFTGGESGTHVPTLIERQAIPPKYYTEATLLHAMEMAGRFVDDEELRAALEENGIGRPPSRASIIETLLKYYYIQHKRKRVVATPFEVQLIDIVGERLLTSYELTGIQERKLHDIEYQKYDAAQSVNKLKAQITTIVNDVLRDNSHSQSGISGAPSK